MSAAWKDTSGCVHPAFVHLLVGALLAGRSIPQLQWEQRPVFGRYSVPVAYDVARARLVLYNFGQLNRPEPQTWEWDGSGWQLRSPAQMPPARNGQALAYDLLRGRTVLFGGGGPVNDTWEWDGAVWIARQPATLPPARFGAGMAYDLSRGCMVLFGGSVGFGYLGDTWEWDGVNWTQRAPSTSPSARGWPGMSFDILRNRALLFGGENIVSGAYGDTWEWDGTNWTQRSTAQQPLPRSRCALAFDIGRARTVLCGGYGDNGDVWEWDGNNWLRIVPPASPPARIEAGLAYDWARGGVLLVGGNGGTTQFGDMWRWDGAQWASVQVASQPLPRSFAAAEWDRARSVWLVFGGLRSPGSYSTTIYFDDTWQWDGARWLELQPSVRPTPRAGAALTYDSNRGRAVLCGGFVTDAAHNPTYFNDTWEWDGTNWQLAATSGPSPRGNAAMAFDTMRGQAVLFGGSNGAFGGTWLWDGIAWQQRTPAVEPPWRYQHAMAYDERRGVVVLFGGAGGTPGNDTWEWDGATWLQRTPAHVPSSRWNHRMTWDAARERVVMSAGSFMPFDVWDWDGIDWQLRAASPAPSVRGGHSFAYDRTRERAVLFGGLDSSGGYFADLWELTPVQAARATSFGAGCPGSLGTPVLDTVDGARPWLGDTVTFRLRPVASGAAAMIAVSSSDAQWAGAPLPAPLDGIGMPGCSLLVGLDDTRTIVGSGGEASFAAAVPVQPALLGVSVYLQAAVVDPGANAAGVVVSNALLCTVGAR